MKKLNNINRIMDIKELERIANVEFTAENEDSDPKDSFYDEESIKYVTDQYENGNEAAWFCAKVEVSYKELSGTDYLGCCCYNSFKEFTHEEGGYYIDMINTCIDEINRQIDSINWATQKNWNIRKAKNLLKDYPFLQICNLSTIQTY